MRCDRRQPPVPPSAFAGFVAIRRPVAGAAPRLIPPRAPTPARTPERRGSSATPPARARPGRNHNRGADRPRQNAAPAPDVETRYRCRAPAPGESFLRHSSMPRPRVRRSHRPVDKTKSPDWPGKPRRFARQPAASRPRMQKKTRQFRRRGIAGRALLRPRRPSRSGRVQIVAQLIARNQAAGNESAAATQTTLY